MVRYNITNQKERRINMNIKRTNAKENFWKCVKIIFTIVFLTSLGTTPTYAISTQIAMLSTDQNGSQFSSQTSGIYRFDESSNVLYFNAVNDFSNIQGYKNWYYMYNFDTPMTYGTNWWGGTSWHDPEGCCAIGGEWTHPGCGGCDAEIATRKWISPADGEAHIYGNVHKMDTTGGNGVNVGIYHNRSLLWSRYIAYNNNIGYNFDITLHVKMGDAIYFTVSNNCENWYDSTSFNPTIALSINSNRPPVASFKSLNVLELGRKNEYTLDGGHMVGGTIRFDPTKSFDPDGKITKYEWNFDNGKKFSTNGPNIYDTKFESARIYNVTLTVTDNGGLTNTSKETLDLTLKDGDLIFIRTAWWNIPFNMAANEYTHVGMYIGKQRMIETILTKNSRSKGLIGVVITPISGWSYPSETYATVVRVKTANDKIRQNAVAFALSKLGQRYDLNVWNKSVDKPNYYCSELVWAAYYKASNGKIDLGNKKKGGVWPDDIMDDTKNIKIIGYHREHLP